MFDEFRAREMSELAPSYASTRLTIDVYCLQHPDRYCVSAKSLAAHLTGVCWAVEHGASEGGLRELQRWPREPARSSVKPALPADHGKLTIADVASVTGPDEYIDGPRSVGAVDVGGLRRPARNRSGLDRRGA